MTQDRTRDRPDGGARAESHGASTMDLSGRCVGSSYILVQPIGQGATGTVWRGLDRSTGEPVAVKLLHESLLRQPKLVTRFVQERTILLMLRHRNVVRVRDLFSVGETLGLVMDLVGGGSLRDHLRERGPVPAGEAARLSAQVAAALAEAHELGIVHRDLKPDNILLQLTDGLLDTRLTDFGVARILNTPSMTTPNAVVGTPHYMAPEAFHGVTASPATDVYALGVLLYELVCGHPPYRSDSIPDLMRRHMAGNPERRPGIPDPVWEVITACMELKPRLRPSAAEVVADLSDAVAVCVDVPALPRPAPSLGGPDDPISDETGGVIWGNTAWPGTGGNGAQSPRPAGSKRAEPERAVPHVSAVPRPRAHKNDNAAPKWRWARSGATVALIAGAMVASAVATIAWNFGRADGPSDTDTPLALTSPASSAAPRTTGTARPRRAPDGPATRTAPRHQPAATATATAGTPAGTPSRVPKKAASTRSPQPEAKPYGPWRCNRFVAFDMRTRTPMMPSPCQMLGRDIQYQGTLTAAGGARASITVSLRDVATGRTVAGPKTCAGLAYEGEAATRGCGPATASPARGHDYAVVMSYRYERDGRTVTSSSRGRTFRW